MKTPGKLKAFTILEVTVAMIIAAVCIGIAYSAYSIMKQSYLQYDSKNKKIAEIVLLEKLLKKDFSEANRIIRTETGFAVNSDKQDVSYRINELSILRTQNSVRTDTFNVAVKDLAMLFTGSPSRVGEPVDKLEVKAVFEDQPFEVVFSKTYSSADLIAFENEKEEYGKQNYNNNR